MSAGFDDSGRAASRIEWALAVIIGVGAAARAAWLLAAAWGFTTDDAWIPLRYARHLAAGVGLLWNPGEPPVEGYSSFPFVILGATTIALGGEPIVALKAVSVAALAGTALGLYALARTWLGPIAAVLPSAILVHDVGEIAWTVSGLETAVFQFLVVFAALASFRALGHASVRQGEPTATSPPRCAPLSAGVLAGLAAVTRPEGAVVFAVLIGAMIAILVRSRAARDRERSDRVITAIFGLVAGFAIVYGPYQAWRLAYFGRLFPNSVYCKMGHPADPWALDRAFWESSWIWLLLSLVQHPSRLDVRHAVLWGIPITYAVILYDVNPIVAHWNRHFLAAFALLLVLATVGATTLARLVGLRDRLRRESAVALVALATVAWQARGLAPGLEAYAASYEARQETRARVAEWVDERVGAAGLVVAGDVGLLGYRTRARVLDAYCLNSPEMTRPPLYGNLDAIVDWIYDRSPDAIVATVPDAKTTFDGFVRTLPARYANRLVRDYALAATFPTPGQAYNYFVFEKRPQRPR